MDILVDKQELVLVLQDLACVAVRATLVELSMYPEHWQQATLCFMEYPCAVTAEDMELVLTANEGLEVPQWQH